MTNASDNSSRRVVITGIGLISPLGSTPQELWSALTQRKSGVVPYEPMASGNLPMPFAGLATQFTGSIGDFGPLEGARKKAIRKGLKLMCRETQMAVAAAQLAMNDAGFAGDSSETTPDPESSGVVLGSDYMLTMPEDYEEAIAKCTADGDLDFSRWGTDGLGDMQPLWMLRYLPNMPASHIAIFNDLRGPNNSLTMREASGLMAIGEAMRIVARGDADRMIAGATGTRVLPMQAIHAMQTEQMASGNDPAAASRPFDKHRTGMVAGEGSGMLMIESHESATARDAKIYGELVGFSSSQVTDRDLNGKNDQALANALRGALKDAGREAPDLGHLNTHGMATAEGDVAEYQALESVLGEHAKTIPAVAIKSAIGNLGAGGGVVELIASLLAYENGNLPPVLNYESPDSECPVAAVTDASVSPGELFASLNVTPQGQAAAVCVERVR